MPKSRRFHEKTSPRRGAQGARLADKANIALTGNSGSKGSVDARQRIHYAQAIWPNDAHLAAPGVFHDLSL